MVAANPLIIIFVLAVDGVDLFAKFAEVVTGVLFITIFAEKSVFVLLDSRADLLVDLL